ncbi:MAG: dihydrodipicolinate synthase family protein [Maricaulaceae bacterium]|jgi:dihydrodipicolinate synthase/N-acetylneuraminate lyase
MTRASDDIIADPIGRYPHATVACFDPTRGAPPRRRLDEARTAAFLERLAEVGVPAALIASSTGQGHLRTVEELDAWFRCAAQAECGEMLLMALLRPEDGPAATDRLLDLLAETAYPVVFLRPGTDLPADADDAQVSDSLAPFVAAAAARGLAIGLYSIPDVSGLPLTPDAAARLVASEGGDHIVAVKVTEADYDRSTARFLAHPDLARLKIVQGWDPHLIRALRDGPRFDAHGRQRVGVTSGLMSLAVHQYKHILSAAAEKAWDEAARAQEAATALFEAMQDDPRSFADLQRAKYIMGLGHPLSAAVTEDQVERVFAALEGLPRAADRMRLARSLDLMGDGPFHQRLVRLAE